MGLVVSRMYFENGLPSLKTIQNQFKQQTGLHLSVVADLYLNEFPSSSKEIVHLLNKDIEAYQKYEESINDEDENNLEHENIDLEKLNYILGINFYLSDFYQIDVFIEGHTIGLYFSLNQVYFPLSLSKVLYDLGGRYVDDEGNPSEGWYNPKRWKKLKHWEDYKWYNRPRK